MLWQLKIGKSLILSDDFFGGMASCWVLLGYPLSFMPLIELIEFGKCIEGIGSHVTFEVRLNSVTTSCKGIRSRCRPVSVLDCLVILV